MDRRRELKKEYKQNPPEMGIFQVKNNCSGKIFIGATVNVQGMLNRIAFQLEVGSYKERELQNDYNQCGAENFSFDILDILEPDKEPKKDYSDDLKELESIWLEKLQPYGDRGYNRPQ